MANYFVNLPAPQVPRNALMDFAPINNALDGIQHQNNVNRQRGDMLEQRDYQRGREQTQDARTQVQWFGKQAEAVDRIADPNQRAAAWQRIIARHPNAAQMDQSYADPMTGPKMVMAEAGQWRDPLESQMGQAKLELVQAQARQAQRGGESPSNVREWTYYNGLKPEDQQRYLTMKRADKFLDTGTSFVRPNQADPTAAPQMVAPKDVAGEAQQKELGQAVGKARADLPRVLDNAALALKTIEQIRNHPGKANGLGVLGVAPAIPGTDQGGFVQLVEQAKGKTFLEAFNSLRGGGQITEAEGNKATQALARLARTQKPGDFETALKDLEEVVRMGAARAQQAAGAGQQSTTSDGWSDLGNGVRIREKR